MSRYLFCVDEARQRAKKRVPRMMFDFVDGASGDESLRDLNSKAMDSVRLMPRVLVDVAERDMSTRILGQEMGFPFGMAPMGMCALTWPGADLFMAREAARKQIPLCVSTAASITLEKAIDVAEGNAWFQLYVDQSVSFVDELVDRAKAAGYEVLILTVDVPIPSVRGRDLRNGFSYPMKWGPRQIWDFATHPHWSLATITHALLHGMPRPMNYATSSQNIKFVRSANRVGADWHFLERLRQRWPGKLVIKGVQCPGDAVRMKSIGVDGIYVSNHGGRQLNAAPTVMDSVQEIRRAVGAEMPLIVDGGVQSGEHVIKALASGADFVMLGRSVMYAIGAGGARGLSEILDLIGNEASSITGLLGHKTLAGINEASLAKSHAAQGNEKG